MKTQCPSMQSDDLLVEWHREAVVGRLLLPRNFMEQVTTNGEELLKCYKKTTELLQMTDRVTSRVVKLAEAREYSSNLNYRPTDFKKLSLTLIDNAHEIICDQCSGRGWLSCPIKMRCRKCDGTTTYQEKCGSCDGTGKNSMWDDYDCGSCNGGERTVNCRECDWGEVRCDRCGGSGAVDCGRCDRDGKLVQASFVVRKFSPSREVKYQLTGLGENEFKNGLSRKHFESLPGDPIGRRQQNSRNPKTTLERLSVHSYDVYSKSYSYKGSRFFLHRIVSRSGVRYVTSKLPFSIRRIVLGGAIAISVLALAIALSVAKMTAIGIVVYGFLIALGIVDMHQWLLE